MVNKWCVSVGSQKSVGNDPPSYAYSNMVLFFSSAHCKSVFSLASKEKKYTVMDKKQIHAFS